MLTLVAAAGQHRAGRHAVGEQRPRHVDALSARDPAGYVSARMTCAPNQPLDVDGPIEAGIESERHDHARITRTPDRLEVLDKVVVEAGVRDEEVQVEQRTEPGQVVVADLRVVGQQHRAAGCRDHRPLHGSLSGIGRGQTPLDRGAVGGHERHVDVEVGERLQCPIVHSGQCPAAETPTRSAGR